MIKSKSRKYRVENKDAIQTRKNEHYAQSRHKIRKKQHNYYEKNVDFIIEKRRISNKQKSENRMELFTKLIKEGPTYTCVICNRCVYQKGTEKFDQSKYKCQFDIIDLKFKNTGDKMYICLTCHGHLKRQNEPPQAVWNKLDITSSAEILSNLDRLERVLISRRILLKKVSLMPKGNFPKLKGSIRNIPIESHDITNVLPRGADSNGQLIVKLKRKLSYMVMHILRLCDLN